jgi:hypothetical protein
MRAEGATGFCWTTASSRPSTPLIPAEAPPYSTSTIEDSSPAYARMPTESSRGSARPRCVHDDQCSRATSGSLPLGINNHGEVVGGYDDNTTRRGFVLSNGTFTSFAAPGTLGESYPRDIDDRGRMVGFYQ